MEPEEIYTLHQHTPTAIHFGTPWLLSPAPEDTGIEGVTMAEIVSEEGRTSAARSIEIPLWGSSP